jgi:hypothetical protein
MDSEQGVDSFVLKREDPAAAFALYTYALHSRRYGMDEDKVRELMDLAESWEEEDGD